MDDIIYGMGFGLISLLLFLYFLPTVIAWFRRKSNTAAIFVLNLFLGWTFVGWIVSLVWAVTKDNKQQPIIVNTNVSNDRTVSPIVPLHPIQDNNILPMKEFPLLSNDTTLTHEDKIKYLKELKELLESGVLTQAEFDRQKIEILNS